MQRCDRLKASSAIRGSQLSSDITTEADIARQEEMEQMQEELQLALQERNIGAVALQEQTSRVSQLEGLLKRQRFAIIWLVVLLVTVLGYLGLTSETVIPEHYHGKAVDKWSYPLIIEAYTDKIRIQNVFLLAAVFVILLQASLLLTSSTPAQAHDPENENRQHWWRQHLFQPVLNVVAPYLGSLIVDLLTAMKNSIMHRP